MKERANLTLICAIFTTRSSLMVKMEKGIML